MAGVFIIRVMSSFESCKNAGTDIAADNYCDQFLRSGRSCFGGTIKEYLFLANICVVNEIKRLFSIY